MSDTFGSSPDNTAPSGSAPAARKSRPNDTISERSGPARLSQTYAGTLTSTARANDLKAFRRVMLAFAFSTVVAGAVIGLVPVGLDAAVSRELSSVLLLVGLIDTFVLRNWRRLFGA